jgi:hypothetical protein
MPDVRPNEMKNEWNIGRRRTAKLVLASFLVSCVLIFAVSAPPPIGLVWHLPTAISDPVIDILLLPAPFFNRLYPSTGSIYSTACINRSLLVDSVAVSAIIFTVLYLRTVLRKEPNKSLKATSHSAEPE